MPKKSNELDTGKLLDWLSFMNGYNEDALTEDEFCEIDTQAYMQVYDLIKIAGKKK